MAESEAKEWLKVTHSNKQTLVTCSLVEGNLSAKWTVKTYASEIKKGVAQARKHARQGLADLRAALIELDAEEDAA